MKSKKLIVLVIALIFVLWTVSTVSAKSERIEFTFTEECDWGTFDPGREIFTGNNYFSRDMRIACLETATIPEYTGTAQPVMNLNYIGSQDRGFWVSQPEGSFVTDEGGIWNLNCRFDGVVAQCVGHGEGLYVGMQVFVDFTPGVGGTGYIVDHNN